MSYARTGHGARMVADAPRPATPAGTLLPELPTCSHDQLGLARRLGPPGHARLHGELLSDRSRGVERTAVLRSQPPMSAAPRVKGDSGRRRLTGRTPSRPARRCPSSTSRRLRRCGTMRLRSRPRSPRTPSRCVRSSCSAIPLASCISPFRMSVAVACACRYAA